MVAAASGSTPNLHDCVRNVRAECWLLGKLRRKAIFFNELENRTCDERRERRGRRKTTVCQGLNFGPKFCVFFLFFQASLALAVVVIKGAITRFLLLAVTTVPTMPSSCGFSGKCGVNVFGGRLFDIRHVRDWREKS